MKKILINKKFIYNRMEAAKNCDCIVIFKLMK